MRATTKNHKFTGKQIAELNGLQIFAQTIFPRHAGKLRVAIHIRQKEGFDWRVEQCLSYGPSVDIKFATETRRNRKGQIV
jgi:hypothetical protein